MKLFLTILLGTFFYLTSFSAEISVKEGQKLVLNGVEAQVKISASSDTKKLQINMLEAASSEFEIEQKDTEIRIQAKNLSDKASSKKRIIEIQGPSIPLEIHLAEGQVQLSQWKKEALIHCQKCKVICREGQGSLAVQVQKGDLLVFNHLGRAEIDSYAATVHLINHNGDIRLENFSGESLVEKAKGSFSINQNQGNIKISAGQGALQFELGKAAFSSQNFAGRIEGQTQEGPVNIQMIGEGEVNVKSQAGRVTVQTVRGIGTWLNLSTQEGDLVVPSPLRVAREGSLKVVKGRLSGEAQKGSIVVRAVEGSVIVK